MKFKIQKYLTMLLLIFIYNKCFSNILPYKKSENIKTVFGGVGNIYEKWYLGYDFLFISTPHTSAYRKIGFSNRSIFIEFWKDDYIGFKTFNTLQEFQTFQSNNINIKTRHIGTLLKFRIPINDLLHSSFASGISQTRTILNGNSIFSNSIVSEFKIGMILYKKIVADGGIITFDGSSGTAFEDFRTGSSNYVIGFKIGF